MASIAERLTQVRENIDTAMARYERAPGSVKLLAVSKTRTAREILQVAQWGQRAFGENYVQEALLKVDDLAPHKLEWHFIGPIQSNKTRPIAEKFDWVHSVDSLRLLERFDRQRPEDKPPLNVCIQVNISREPQKSGISPEKLAEVAQAASELPRLKLRGLMAIPAPEEDVQRQREPFLALREAMANLHLPELDTLSMGMTNDMEAAIAEGSTMVRIGTAIFGERYKR
ncbi:MAG: YggS family pyridoxal phosphate-dependent enzyme [Pseudomonadota bacterium]